MSCFQRKRRTGDFILVFSAATTRSEKTFDMLWSEKAGGTQTQAEVVLYFAEFPAHYIGIRSDQLRDYLQSTGERRIEVAFGVTRDIGCLRGFSPTRLGELTSWNSGLGG